MKSFSEALASGALPALTHFYLDGNQIGDAGLTSFSGALASGALASLEMLYVDDGPLGTEHPALKAACEARGIQLP